MSEYDIDIELLPKQYQFLISEKKFVLYSGGRGSGKSKVLCYKAFQEASKPNNQVLLVRKQLSDLKSSTLDSLIGNGGVIPQNLIEQHNKTEFFVKIVGGGIIRYRGLDRSTGVRSMNIGCLCMDEVTEFNENEFEELVYCLRNPYGSRQVFMATNPGAPNPENFLYRKFFLEDNDDQELITTSSYDNWHLPPDYFDSFKHMDPDRKKRMVEGLWVAIEGTVFNNFDRRKHVKKLEVGVYDEHILAIDWGQTHVAAFILAGIKGRKVSVLEEYAKSDMLIRDIKAKIFELKDKYNNLSIYYDPSAPILSNELSNVGVTLKKANNDKAVGLDRIRNKLGECNLEIDESCIKLISEFENYVYKPGSDQPVKVGDDCLDSLRYIINAVDDGEGSFIYPKFIEDKEEDEVDEWDESLFNQLH